MLGCGRGPPGHAIAVLLAEGTRRLLGQRVAVALAIGGPHERGDDVEVPFADVGGLAPELGEAEVDVQLKEVDARRVICHCVHARDRVGRTRVRHMGEIRVGPSGLPDAASFEEAAQALAASGYRACEIGFVSGFWLDYEAAPQLGEALRAADVALSVHAPLAAFMGHVGREKKFKMALGMLDHTAGLAKAAGAELIVFHPGFLLGRERERAIADVVDQLGDLRERLESKDRLVPFGVEVMGRARELGTIDDVLAIASQVDFVRPVLDFAHMHATSDGAYTDVDAFASVLAATDDLLEPGAPFHIHFSDIAFANRNETKHLPYGEGTLRVEPLRDSLARFERPATVISESPDSLSTQTIGSVLIGDIAARRTS